uniref:Secreted protein n=1 Tax=Globodera rostochiensis TaxID=31243 RepID=A0A914ICB7_GLORO
MFFRLFILFSVLLTHFGTAAPNVGKISANILQQQLNAEYVVVISDPITSADVGAISVSENLPKLTKNEAVYHLVS